MFDGLAARASGIRIGYKELQARIEQPGVLFRSTKHKKCMKLAILLSSVCWSGRWGKSTQIVICFNQLAAGCRDMKVDQPRRHERGAFGILYVRDMMKFRLFSLRLAAQTQDRLVGRSMIHKRLAAMNIRCGVLLFADTYSE